MVPHWLIEAGISGPALKLYVVLGEFANRRSKEAWPSRGKLAQRLSVSTRTVDTGMAELVEIGAVEKSVRKRDDGGQTSNTYRLLLLHPEERGGVKPSFARGGSLASPELEPENQKSSSTDVELAPSTPKAIRVGGRDLAYDAVAEACGILEGSPRLRGIPAALNGPEGIRAQAWREVVAWLEGSRNPPEGEEYERMLAEGIRRRAALYRQKMPGVALTPSALKKWWTDLPSMDDPRDGRSGSAADVVSVVDEAVRRERGTG